jgi:hypothetical protein
MDVEECPPARMIPDFGKIFPSRCASVVAAFGNADEHHFGRFSLRSAISCAMRVSARWMAMRVEDDRGFRHWGKSSSFSS